MDMPASSHSNSSITSKVELDEHDHELRDKGLKPVRSTESEILPDVSSAPEVVNLREPSSGPADVEKAEKPNPFAPESYPEGGLDAWLCTLGAFLCLFVSFGWINCEYLLFLSFPFQTPNRSQVSASSKTITRPILSKPSARALSHG
jgi:hypothetical protein